MVHRNYAIFCLFFSVFEKKSSDCNSWLRNNVFFFFFFSLYIHSNTYKHVTMNYSQWNWQSEIMSLKLADVSKNIGLSDLLKKDFFDSPESNVCLSWVSYLCIVSVCVIYLIMNVLCFCVQPWTHVRSSIWFYRCIDVAGAYSAQKTELNISLTAIGLLWTSTDFIVKGASYGSQREKETGLLTIVALLLNSYLW